MQPHLCNDLVELRPLAADDFDALFEVASDPLIWEQHPYKSRAERAGFEKFFGESIDSKGAFAVIDRGENKIIGTCKFYECDYENSEIELGGAFLARDYWGGKWASDIVVLMLDHAFKFVDQAVFLVDYDNIRSQRAVEKFGARKSKDRKNQDGIMHRCYTLKREEYEALRKSKI
jgi:RimJ/RimL family protein N-acetyltransferase